MKEQIKAYKRARILEAALQLFYAHGFAGTTVEALAEHLSVTKPFIYAHFKSKAALLVALYEEVTTRLLADLTTLLSSEAGPDRMLAEFVGWFARENMESQMITTVFLQEEKHLDERTLKRVRKLQKTFDARLADLIRRGIEAGTFVVEDPAIAALAIIGMARWIQRWYRPDGRLSVDDIGRMMAEFALRIVQCRPAASVVAAPRGDRAARVSRA